jgi:hypothetical protein
MKDPVLIVRKLAEEKLVKLGEKISRNASHLDNNTYGPNCQILEDIITYQLDLYAAIESYLESEDNEINILKFIISMNLKSVSIMTASKVTLSFRCLKEIQSLHDMVKKFNDDELTALSNVYLKLAKRIFSEEDAEIPLDEKELNDILSLVRERKESIKTKIN